MWLLLKNIIFTVLVPGTLAVYVQSCWRAHRAGSVYDGALPPRRELNNRG
jgi:hypothetical protein